MSKVVKFFYSLSDANTKELLESNAGSGELAFVSGKNQILPALEEALLAMNVGDTKDIIIACKDALGNYDENLIQLLPKEQFAGIDLQIGMELFGEDEQGQTARVRVKDIKEENVEIDFNHPYAGKDLFFQVQVTEYRDADANEELSGVVVMPHTCACSHGNNHNEEGCCGKHKHHDEEGCCGKHKH